MVGGQSKSSSKHRIKTNPLPDQTAQQGDYLRKRQQDMKYDLKVANCIGGVLHPLVAYH